MNFLLEVEKLKIKLNEKQLADLEKYFNLLIVNNKKYNLTSIVEKEDVYLKHFYDSLTLIKAIDLKKDLTLCDVGTGAGFPGIVLKIVFPNLKITLVDSLTKRINFLNLVIKELNLKDIKVINKRGEEFARENRNSFDIVTARAVMNLRMLNEICLPLVKKEGYFIPMKAKAEEEIKDSANSLKKLNGIIEEKIKFNLPIENSVRTLIKIKKVKESNKMYPRLFSLIKKKPL